MATSTTKINKPFSPRGNDQSPLAYNRAKLYSGKALDFDGVNDYVDCGTLDVTGYTQITFSTYLNIDTLVDQRIVSLRHSGGDDLRIFTATGKGNVIAFATDDTTPVTIETPLTFNEWFHVVMTHDGTTLTAYINGQEAVSAASDFNYSTADGELFLGAWSNGSPSLYYDGEMAGFKAFNTALTAAQVADLYNNPEKVVPTGVDNTALKLWLPMMEGAGTTAYDGSGNGNHGTISGATYVNGVGAPVSQSAVISWNKGINETAYSEAFNSWTTKNDITIVDNDATAPDGQETAATITFAASQANARVQDFKAGAFESKTQIVSVWARATSGTETFRFKCSHGGVIDYFSNDLTATTEWQRFSFSQTFGSTGGTGVFYGLYNGTDLASRSLEFWGFQLQTDAAALTPYIPTLSTAQTSPVLLPQGLTTGRDITGVNLFENVRKQGALNLDGNSWAEVHDNESLDFGTGSLTLEAWVKVKYVNNGSALNVVMTLGGNMSSAGAVGMHISSSLKGAGVYNNLYNNSVTTLTTGDWVHLVSVYDGTNNIVYINGSADNSLARTAADITNALVKHIGRDSTSNRFYNDQLAQPRIYNRALTAEEVQRNYNAGKNTYTNS